MGLRSLHLHPVVALPASLALAFLLPLAFHLHLPNEPSSFRGASTQASECLDCSAYEIERDSWLADRALADLALRSEGVTVLGVEHPDGTYQGAPDGSPALRQGETLILDGRSDRLQELSNRREGDRATHRAAVSEAGDAVARRQAGADGGDDRDSGSDTFRHGSDGCHPNTATDD